MLYLTHKIITLISYISKLYKFKSILYNTLKSKFLTFLICMATKLQILMKKL